MRWLALRVKLEFQMKHTITGPSITMESVSCATAAGIGAWGVKAGLGTIINVQCALVNVWWRKHGWFTARQQELVTVYLCN